MKRWVRRSLIGLLAVPLTGAAVLGVEVQQARSAPDLPDARPYRLDGRIGSGPGPALRMVWLGDSTAAGVGASSPDHALPRLVASAVAASTGRPVQLTALGVSGATVGDVLHHQVAQVPADAEIVVVDIGSNDVTHLTSRSVFRSRYASVLDRLPTSARVVLLGVPDIGSPTRLEQPLRFIAGVRGGTLDAVVHSLSVARHLGYVDIAGAAGPPTRRNPGRYLAADHYHPSDAGYRLWADAVVPVVRRELHG